MIRLELDFKACSWCQLSLYDARTICLTSGGGDDLVTKSCPALGSSCSPEAPLSMQVSQVRILEQEVAISFLLAGDLPDPGPGIKPGSLAALQALVHYRWILHQLRHQRFVTSMQERKTLLKKTVADSQY